MDCQGCKLIYAYAQHWLMSRRQSPRLHLRPRLPLREHKRRLHPVRLLESHLKETVQARHLPHRRPVALRHLLAVILLAWPLLLPRLNHLTVLRAAKSRCWLNQSRLVICPSIVRLYLVLVLQVRRGLLLQVRLLLEEACRRRRLRRLLSMICYRDRRPSGRLRLRKSR
jgi:hypothetical protein